MKWRPSALAFFGGAGALLGCAGALLAGCSVGPTYRRPQIAAPEHWHESAGDAPGANASASIWPDTEWWHGFGSARLDALIAEAERSNDDLAGAIARVQEADAQARIAGAALLPSLDAGMSASRQRAQVTGEGPQVFNDFNPELSASYEIDFWGKNRAARDAARAAAAASRYDRQTVALTVISSVATTYFQALELRDRIE
ncbi:MAG: TolC family protein, partial [Steroidobacteraceae bacterium]